MEGATGYLFAFCGLSVFLLIGKLARVKIKILQTLFLPSAIIGGFVAMAFGPHALDLIPHWMVDKWSELPGMLINVVFASLFLGVALPGPRALPATMAPGGPKRPARSISSEVGFFR